MNPDLSRLSREELEPKLTALLLGELDPAEAAALRSLLEEQEDLRKLHRDLASTLDLVREAVAHPAGGPAGTTKPWLEASRREDLLARLRSVPPPPQAAAEAGVSTIPVAFPAEAGPSDAVGSRWTRFQGGLGLALAACLVALLGAASLWLTGSRRAGRGQILALGETRAPVWFRVQASQAERGLEFTNGLSDPAQVVAPAAASAPAAANRTRVLAWGFQPASPEPAEESLSRNLLPDVSARGAAAAARAPSGTSGRNQGELEVLERQQVEAPAAEAKYAQVAEGRASTRRGLSLGVPIQVSGGLGGGGAVETSPGVPEVALSSAVQAPSAGGNAPEARFRVEAAPTATLSPVTALADSPFPADPTAGVTVTDVRGEARSAPGPVGEETLAKRVRAKGAVATGGKDEAAPSVFFATPGLEVRDGGAAGGAGRGPGGGAAARLAMVPQLMSRFGPRDARAGDAPPPAPPAPIERLAELSRDRAASPAPASAEPVVRFDSFAFQEAPVGNGPVTARRAGGVSAAKPDVPVLGDAAELGALFSKESSGLARGTSLASDKNPPEVRTPVASRPALSLPGLAQDEKTSVLGRRVLSQQAVEALPPTRKIAPPLVPQPEVVAADDSFSTFSLNVTDVSFKLAGAALDGGSMPEPGTIRSEEFVNAFEYRDPEPASGRPIGFAWERAAAPFAQQRDVLRLAVRTAALGREAGRPLNLVLAVDGSGSMERADRVRILREAMRALAGQLKAGDRVSLISFARTARLWLEGVPAERATEWVEAVDRLTPEGGTNLEDALRVGYETALKHFAPQGVNRVVLLTDGAANLGDLDPESLRRLVTSYRQRGVALDAFGIGWEGFNDDLLESLTRNGDGRYGFINSPEEAATGFAAQLAGALQVAANDVKVQVEFNPRRVRVWRQIGYARHQLTREQFRDNTVDAAELGAAESGNALYVVETLPSGEGPVATARVRFRTPGTGAYEEHEWVVPYTGPALPLTQSSPALRLAVVAASFSEWLAASPFAAEATPSRLLPLLTGVAHTFQPDPRPARLEAMIRQAQSLSGP